MSAFSFWSASPLRPFADEMDQQAHLDQQAHFCAYPRAQLEPGVFWGRVLSFACFGFAMRKKFGKTRKTQNDLIKCSPVSF